MSRCLACARDFTPRRKDHRYCSAKCRGRGLAQRRVQQLTAALAGLAAAQRVLEEERRRWTKA
jgi:hypothetical protein